MDGGHEGMAVTDLGGMGGGKPTAGKKNVGDCARIPFAPNIVRPEELSKLRSGLGAAIVPPQRDLDKG